MGWISRLLDRVAGVTPTDWTLIQSLPDPGFGIAGKAIEPGKCYIEVYVESLRLEKARRFATTFDGVVYSFVTLARDASERVDLAAVTRPQNLASIGDDRLGRVVSVEKRMLGVMPWRGNPLGLELGLFSVKAGNLLTPLVSYVTKISELAGISAANKINPFLPLITEGLDMIAGQTSDTEIELAIDTDMTIGESVICALVAKEKTQLDTDKVTIDPDDRKLLDAGRPLDAAYCVFSVRARPDNPEWGNITALKDAIDDFKRALIAGKRSDAEEALAGFNRQVIVSPDLIDDDKKKLKEKARAWLVEAFPGGGVSKLKGELEERFAARNLSDLKLYDN